MNNVDKNKVTFTSSERKVNELIKNFGISNLTYIKSINNLKIRNSEKELTDNHFGYYGFIYKNKKYTFVSNRLIEASIYHSEEFHGYDERDEDGNPHRIDNGEYFSVAGYDEDFDDIDDAINIIMDAIKGKDYCSDVLEEIEDTYEYPYIAPIKLYNEKEVPNLNGIYNSLLLDEDNMTCTKDDTEAKEIVKFFNDVLFQDIDSDAKLDDELNVASKFFAKLIH